MTDFSFDCDAATKYLLCTETDNLCFDDFDSEDQSHQTNDHNLESKVVRSETLTGVLPLLSEESARLMFVQEKQHLPKNDYLQRLRSGNLDLSIRREALDWIWKAHAHYSFGAPSLCLATNYLDRFLSVYELPEEKSWTVQLLAVACLSLAAKMEEIEVPLIADLQVGDPKYLFEGKTIKRMELLVLSTLKWRMQACGPCSFIDYFLRKIGNNRVPSESLINRSIQFILSTIKAVDFLESRPSEVAAAVALCVSRDLEPIDINKAVSCFVHVEKVRVMKCIELIKDLKLIGESSNVARGGAAALVPQSPAGVLEAETCLSYKSEERRVGSLCPNLSHTSPDTKRRKLDTTTSQQDFT